MAKKQINVKLEQDLIDDLSLKLNGRNRQAYIEGLIKQDLYGEIEPGKDVGVNLAKLESNAKMDKLLDEALLEVFAANPVEFLGNLDAKQLSDLLIKRMPKPVSGDADLESQALSLKGCLEMLPGMDDITGELSRAKNRIKKLEFEFEMQNQTIQMLRKKLRKECVWSELKGWLDKAAGFVNQYAYDCDARDLDYKPLKMLAIRGGVVDGIESE